MSLAPAETAPPRTRPALLTATRSVRLIVCCMVLDPSS